MHRIGLLLFDDVDVLDVGGPYEVFLTANRLVARTGDDPPFAVATLAVGDRRVTAYGGLGLEATRDHLEAGDLDVLVVPGAVDVESVIARRRLMDGIVRLAGTSTLTTSVCTGALLLAHAGVLGDVAATTHHEDVQALAAVIGDRAVTARWVDAGDVVTAGGLSSGLAMALHLVDRLVGRDLAVATAEQLAHEWDPDDGLVVGA